jgi:DNA-binding response OmpR family regulator
VQHAAWGVYYRVMETRKTILIVEDSALLRDVLRDALDEAGFTVVTAENGKIGLEVAFRILPDLIMLDLIMPVMDGMTMYQRLRGDASWGAKVPVIMLSATKTDKIMSWLSAEKLDFFMKDNYMMEDIVTSVKKRLGVKAPQ